MIARGNPLFQGANDVTVAAREELVEQLHHRDLGAEGVVHRSHLETDDAASHHEEATRDLGELEGARRIDDPGVVPGKVGQPHRLRSGRDDRVLEPDAPDRAFGRLDREDPGALEPSGPLHDLHLAALREFREPAGEAFHHVVLPVRELSDVDCRCPVVHSARPELGCRGHGLGGAEERLGGNAADVEAHPTQGRVPLDEHGLPAEVGGPEGGRVAPRPRPEDHHVGAEVDVVRDGGGGVGGLDARRGSGRRLRGGRWRGRGGRSGRLRRGPGSRRFARLRRRSAGSGLVRHLAGGSGPGPRIETHQHGSRRDAVSDRDLDGGDHAFDRRREVHARLVALEDDHGVVEPDPVSR